MGNLLTHFHQTKRKINPSDIKQHFIAGSTQDITRLLYEIQGDSRWVEKIGDSIYFRAFFIYIRQSAENMIVFEVNAGDRTMAEKFDQYLIAKAGELDLRHSQPVTVKEVTK